MRFATSGAPWEAGGVSAGTHARHIAAVAIVAVTALGVAACTGTDASTVATGADDKGTEVDADAGTVADSDDSTTTTESTTTTTRPERAPAETLSMKKLRTVSGDISPKSVVSSGHGHVTAQNMMYTHTVTAYDEDGELVATVPDDVRLTDFGIDEPGEFKGSPVEAAFVPDGSQVYVSNYSMFGPGHSEGKDKCSPGDGTTDSYLYRISTEDWKINQVIPAGAVPKYVAVTPDAKTVIASNWCTWDLTIADVETGSVTRTVDMGGRYPRGIAVSPDSTTAYVGIMGGSEIKKVDLASGSVSTLASVGAGPRHVVISPDGSTLYVTLNKAGKVVKVDAATGKVLGSVATGNQPRSADISTDGTAMYVVNYDDSTMSKIRTSDMSIIETVKAGYHPIGIAYDDLTGRVWVANYGGTIDIWDEVDGG